MDETVLNNELQQLGLPKENSDGLSRPFRIHRDRLRVQAQEDSLRLPRLVSMAWRTDAVIYDSSLGDLRGTSTKGGGGTKQQQQLVPVHHLRLGLSHTLGGTYPGFQATGAADTPLLLAHRGAVDADTPLLALGMRPLFPGQAGCTPALVPRAQLEFSVSQSQARALLAELGAAKSVLAELTASLPQPS